jgi:hypothetical protein
MIGFFCKTFRDDLPLARVALELLGLNWVGERPEVVLMLDEDCRELVKDWDFPSLQIRYEFVKPWHDGYCHAMAMKACADLFMPNDPIFLLDSDTMLSSESGRAKLMPKGLPVLIYQKWDDRDRVNSVAQAVWGPAIARSLGIRLSADWMVHPERLYWRSTFQMARELVAHHCRLPFLKAVESLDPYDWERFPSHQMTLCENEMLPMLGAMFEAQLYDIRQLEKADFAGGFTQLWSHAPLDRELLDKWLMEARDRRLEEDLAVKHHQR